MRIFLPIATADNSPVHDRNAAEAPAPLKASGGRILVLDDDAAVRSVLVDNLRAHGYSVFDAETGEDALNTLVRVDPDLFIIDFMMPGMTGAEVAARARTVRPKQKILVVSGYLDSEALSTVASDIPILRKPFDGPQLATKVAALLRVAQPGGPR